MSPSAFVALRRRLLRSQEKVKALAIALQQKEDVIEDQQDRLTQKDDQLELATAAIADLSSQLKVLQEESRISASDAKVRASDAAGALRELQLQVVMASSAAASNRAEGDDLGLVASVVREEAHMICVACCAFVFAV